MLFRSARADFVLKMVHVKGHTKESDTLWSVDENYLSIFYYVYIA